MNTKNLEASIRLWILRDDLRHRGFDKPIPEFILAYFDLLAEDMLDIAYARRSERHKGYVLVPPTGKPALLRTLLEALQFEPATAAGFKSYADQTRLNKIRTIVLHAHWYKIRSRIDLDTVVHERIGVDMDQAANLVSEAEEYEPIYNSFRKQYLQRVSRWLQERRSKKTRVVADLRA